LRGQIQFFFDNRQYFGFHAFETIHLLEHGFAAMVGGFLVNPFGDRGPPRFSAIAWPDFLFDAAGLALHVIAQVKRHIVLEDENLDHHFQGTRTFDALEVLDELLELLLVRPDERQNGIFQAIELTRVECGLQVFHDCRGQANPLKQNGGKTSTPYRSYQEA
jgi:hypothetical protein